MNIFSNGDIGYSVIEDMCLFPVDSVYIVPFSRSMDRLGSFCGHNLPAK